MLIGANLCYVKFEGGTLQNVSYILTTNESWSNARSSNDQLLVNGIVCLHKFAGSWIARTIWQFREYKCYPILRRAQIDIDLCDFFLFSIVKNRVRERKFNTADEAVFFNVMKLVHPNALVHRDWRGIFWITVTKFFSVLQFFNSLTIFGRALLEYL